MKKPKARPLTYAGLFGGELPKCKGRVLDIDERAPECPIHNIEGRRTGWFPPSGLDPNTREYACPCGHAYYAVKGAPKK